MFPEYIRPEEAASFLNVAPVTLAKWRIDGTGPRFSKLSRKCVLYRVDDLRQWVADRRRTSTSEQGGLR